MSSGGGDPRRDGGLPVPPGPAAPLVIVGMHRSGTSLLARLLEPLGVFLGRVKTPDHEARFFRTLNDWILHQLGIVWDDPRDLERLAGDAHLRPLVLAHLRHYLGSPRLCTYLGVARYLRHRSLASLPGSWGWKDPRNSLTLEFWAELFPGLRVVHVRRHGVDVAASLRAREERLLERGSGLSGPRRLLYSLVPRRSRLLSTVRGLELEWGFSLWERYLAAVQAGLARLDVPRLEVGYEELLSSPGPVLASVASFSGLAPAPEDVARLTRDVRPDRRFAYRGDPTLIRFAAEMADRLRPHGYDA